MLQEIFFSLWLVKKKLIEFVGFIIFEIYSRRSIFFFSYAKYKKRDEKMEKQDGISLLKLIEKYFRVTADRGLTAKIGLHDLSVSAVFP